MAPTQVEPRRRRDLLKEVSFGAIVGLVAGLAFVEFPPIGLPLAIVLLALGIRQEPIRAWFPSALLFAGTLWLVLDVTTTIDCAGTEDFCGHAKHTPLALLGAAVVAAGLVVSLRVWRQYLRA